MGADRTEVVQRRKRSWTVTRSRHQERWTRESNLCHDEDFAVLEQGITLPPEALPQRLVSPHLSPIDRHWLGDVLRWVVRTHLLMKVRWHRKSSPAATRSAMR